MRLLVSLTAAQCRFAPSLTISIVIAALLACVGCGDDAPSSAGEISAQPESQGAELNSDELGDGPPPALSLSEGYLRRSQSARWSDNSGRRSIEAPGAALPLPPKQPGSVTWNRWRGPHFNGMSHETDWIPEFPREGPKMLWRQKIGVGFSSLAIANERVYTMGNKNDHDVVTCIDAETGKIIWNTGYLASPDGGLYGGGPSATPTVQNGKVYTLGKDGTLLCLNANDGATLWKNELTHLTGAELPKYGFTGSPLIMGKQIILNAGGAGLAYHKDTGDLLWASKGLGGYASPLPYRMEGREVALLFSDQHIVAVDPADDGRGVWSHTWRTRERVNAADPLLVRDKIFVSSGYGGGCAMFQMRDGKPSLMWRTQSLRSHYNPGVAIGKFVYGIDGHADGSAKNSLVCVNLTTGKPTWIRRNFGHGSLIAAGNYLIALTELGELYILKANPHAYTEISYARVIGRRCWTAPAISGGRVYCRNAKGTVVCIDLRPPESLEDKKFADAKAK
jgi:outer membrane protein assembly factor BamB